MRRSSDGPEDHYTSQSEPLHSKSIVIDACTWLYANPAQFLDPARVTAALVTVPHRVYHAFPRAVEEIGWVRQGVRSDAHAQIVETAEDIRKAKDRGVVGLVLAFQHSKPLETDLSRVETFHKLGIRVMQVTYNERTYAGDGCFEPRDAGLSEFGRRLIRELNQIGVVVDLTHASVRTSLEAIEVTRTPPIFSHANPTSVTRNPRNITDAQIKAAADAGGVIGCCTWAPLCCKNQKGHRPNVEDYLDHVQYVVDLVGIDHVGVATDSPLREDLHEIADERQDINTRFPGLSMDYWRGVFPRPEEADDRTWHEYSQPEGIPGVQDLRAITGGLSRRGYSAEDIMKVLGGNFLRVFAETWKE
jgi:membrane dipeptidase